MAQATPNHALITAGRVTDTAVYNLSGDKIGRIEDLSIDKVSGQVRYALLSFGGFLHIGERYHPLPWGVLDYDTEKDGYVLPLTKEQLENAPSYTRSELEAFGGGDQSYRDNLFAYYNDYGVAPYWL